MAQRKQSSFAKSGFRNSVFEAPVIMEGWLKKHSTGMIKRWQKRYFTIAGHYMKYYEDEAKDEKTLKGTIDIEEARVVVKLKLSFVVPREKLRKSILKRLRKADFANP